MKKDYSELQAQRIKTHKEMAKTVALAMEQQPYLDGYMITTFSCGETKCYASIPENIDMLALRFGVDDFLQSQDPDEE